MALSGAASADEPAFTSLDILGPERPYYRLESASVRFTHYDQRGRGYQSRAGPPYGPGDQRLWVEQPQAELVFKQGDKITHRVWVPVDIVTAASPDAIDIVSTSSARNEAASIDWTTTYTPSPRASLFARVLFHAEENYHSWVLGLGGSYSFAEDNTVVSVNGNQVIDWFDQYHISGKFGPHGARSSTNGNIGVTQLLSPTTIANLNYGLTVQQGQLSNTWNIVPVSDRRTVVQELLPRRRIRHAFVGRLAQYLPWDGAFKGSYRFYIDDWGIRAHTFDFELDQRLAWFAFAGVYYRVHAQTGASFYTTSVAPDSMVGWVGVPGEGTPKGAKIKTADSDLAGLVAQSIGFKGTFDFPSPLPFARAMKVELLLERYFRSNDLAVTVYSCGTGFTF